MLSSTLILRSVCTLSRGYIWISFGVLFYGKKLHLFSVIDIYNSLLHSYSFHIHLTTHYFKKMFTFGLNYMIDLNIIVIFHRNYHIIVLHLHIII